MQILVYTLLYVQCDLKIPNCEFFITEYMFESKEVNSFDVLLLELDL